MITLKNVGLVLLIAVLAAIILGTVGIAGYAFWEAIVVVCKEFSSRGIGYEFMLAVLIVIIILAWFRLFLESFTWLKWAYKKLKNGN